MQEFHVALAALGGLVLVLCFVRVQIERFVLLSRPAVALLVGIVLGPDVLGLLTPDTWEVPRHVVIEAVTSLTIGIAVMAVALQLPRKYLASQWRTMLLVLAVVMPFMWLTSSVLAFAILGLPLWTALLIGAVVTPTDPVLSSTVVRGIVARENLPERLRLALAAESGANDGLAYMLVLLPVVVSALSPHEHVGNWLFDIVLIDVVGAIALGAVIGLAAGAVTKRADERGSLEDSSLLAVTLALTLLVLGVGELLHVNGLIAVFAAGIGYDHAATTEEKERDDMVQQSIDQFFTIPVFAVLGLYLPWRDWLAMGWPLVALALAILLLRRLPAFLLFGRWMPAYHGMRESAFAGWFGPIGVAALYYANDVQHRTGMHEVWTITTLVVIGSLVLHGCTCTPLTRALGRHPARS